MIRRAVRLTKGLQKQIEYGYLTPIEKPVTSLALSSLVELSSEALQYCHLEFAFAPALSVLAGAFIFRVGLEFAGLFFQSLTHRRKDTWANRWIEKIFLVDMRRDATFYELPEQKYTEMARYYQPEMLFTCLLKTYAMLNFLRGGHSLITDTTLASFWGEGLLQFSLHDPYFMLPVGVMAVNYLILSRSRHPFFIHLVRRENRLMCFNFAFMSGLLFVAAPAIYPLSYIGLALGHLSMRSLSHFGKDCKKTLSDLLRMKKK